MKKLLHILQLIKLIVFLPFEVLRGSKKRAYKRIKKTMLAANLL